MKDSLASERRYTFATLPLGVLRALGEGLVGWKFPAYQRAGSIIVGLAVTTAGYFVGTFFVPGNEKSVTLARVPLPSDN